MIRICVAWESDTVQSGDCPLFTSEVSTWVFLIYLLFKWFLGVLMVLLTLNVAQLVGGGYCCRSERRVKQESPWWYCVMRDSCHSRVRMCEMVISAAASPFYSLGLGLGLRHCHVVVAELEVLQLKQTMWQVADGDNPLKSITKDRGFVLCTFCTSQKCKSFLFICHHMPSYARCVCRVQ